MSMRGPLYDAHNHLQDPWLEPHRARVFADLAQLPLARAVVNGTAEDDWGEVAALAQAHRFIQPSFGLHPWNVGNASPHWQPALTARLDANPAAAVGEIGLDRWILERARPDDVRLAGLRRASLEEQMSAFTWQLALAAGRNLPVTIHCLDAWGALRQGLRSTPPPARGFLLHAYGGSVESARELAELGAYFSFNGWFLDPRHQAKLAVFTHLPLDRLLVETDAPAMPLVAERRTHELPARDEDTPLNHPANLGAAYDALAAVRGMEIERLVDQVAVNFTRLFGPART
jgi:TatD DNase family protein